MHLPPKPTAALLNQQPFFHGIAWTPLERLAQLAAYVRFSPGEVIFSEGGIADRFYVVLAGRVTLESRGVVGEVVPVQSLEAGEALGWSWLFPPYRWSFTARSVEMVEGLVFPGEVIRSRCEEDPALGCAIMKRVAGVMLDRLQSSRRRLAALQHASAGIPIRVTVAGARPQE